MPNALIPLPDVYESVTRRVAVDVTSQLARLMQLPPETSVYLPGNAEVTPMNGGTFGNCCDRSVKMSAAEKLVVTYTEEADESYTLTTPVNNREIPPIFEDRDHGIVMRPVYRYVTMMVSLTYTAPNITIAQRWIDDMRNRISMGRAELYQTLQYHYAVPKPCLALFKALYETQESSEFPTGETYEDWLAARFKQPTKTIATLINTDRTLAIPEKQFEVLGWFDFTTTPPQPDRSSERDGSYSTTITYQLRYNRPTEVYVKYPFLMHQRPIPRLFRAKEPYETFRAKTRKVSTTKGSFDLMMQLMQVNVLPYVHYPNTDDFVADYIPKGRLTFFTGLMALKSTDLRSVCDLANLGEFRFNPYFLEYFYQQGNRVFKQFAALFEFRVYENETYRADVQLEFRPGTVRVQATEDLDPTKVYHVQISLVSNWMTIEREVFTCLRRYPHVTYYTLKALGVSLGRAERYADLQLIGYGAPRPWSELCKGEGVTIGPVLENPSAPGGSTGGVVVPGLPWTDRTDAEREEVADRGVIKVGDIEKAISDTNTAIHQPGRFPSAGGGAGGGWGPNGTNGRGTMSVLHLGIITYINKEPKNG